MRIWSIKIIVYIIIVLLAHTGCTRVVYVKQPCNCTKVNTFETSSKKATISNSTSTYRKSVHRLRQKASPYWGRKAKVASRFEYVQYSDAYKARSRINFATNRVYVETTTTKNPKSVLRHLVATTLLSPQNPETIDLFGSRHDIQVGVPFLYHRVRDHDGMNVRWRWRAYRYADYLIAKKLQISRIKTTTGYKTRYAVSFPMQQRQFSKGSSTHYASIVHKHARRFNLDPALIFALIETESHFNPFATSAIPAYGLMQVVPSSAGRDAWRFLKKRKGKPSRNYLFNADNNIEMGSAYMHILQTRYLDKIRHPKAREYCAIAAYNTGAGNVLRSFSRNKNKAIQKINTLSPEAVYWHLRKKLPYDETRRYVAKVIKAKKNYQ